MENEFNTKKKEMTAIQSNAHQAQEMELKGKLYTDNVIKKMLIDTHQSICSKVEVQNYQTVNVGSGDLKNNSAGAVLGQIFGTANAIKAGIEGGEVKKKWFSDDIEKFYLNKHKK